VAELCRSALEYACQRTVWRVRTARGERHADIEEALRHAHKTTTLFALALFDDAERGGDVLSRLRNAFGGWAVNAYDLSRKAVHGGHPVIDPPGLVSDTPSTRRGTAMTHPAGAWTPRTACSAAGPPGCGGRRRAHASSGWRWSSPSSSTG
jgi:hypothetical protein